MPVLQLHCACLMRATEIGVPRNATATPAPFHALRLTAY
jgi:hypothetical protein